MGLLDRAKELFRAPGVVTHDDVINDFKKQYPIYENVPNEELAHDLSSKMQKDYGYLTGYDSSASVPAPLVPKQLRGEDFYVANPDIGKKDALEKVAAFRAKYPIYKDVPDVELAGDMEKSYPNRFKGLSTFAQFDPEAEPVKPSSSFRDLMETEGTKALKIGQQAVHKMNDIASSAETHLISGLMNVPASYFKADVLPGVHPPLEFGRDLALAGAVEVGGIYQGLTGQELKLDPGSIKSLAERKVSPDIAKSAGEIVGGLSLLSGVGAAVRWAGAGEYVTQVFARTPRIARMIGAGARAGMEFGGAGAIQEAIKEVGDGKVSLKDFGTRVLKDTAIGIGFGGVQAGTAGQLKGAIPDALAQTAGGAAYGFGVSIAQGHDLATSAISGGIAGLYALAGAKDATEAQKLGAFKTATANVESAARAEATRRGYSKEATDGLAAAAKSKFTDFVNKIKGDEVDIKGWDKIAKDVHGEMKKVFDAAEGKPGEATAKLAGPDVPRGTSDGKPPTAPVAPEITRVSETTVDPDLLNTVNTKLPALGEMIKGQDFPVSKDRLNTELRKALALHNESTINGNDPAEAQVAAVRSFAEAMKTAGKEQLAPTTPGKTPSAAVAESLGLKPAQMTPDVYRSVYGEGRPAAEVSLEHKQRVTDALAKNEPVPPEVLKEYPDLTPSGKSISSTPPAKEGGTAYHGSPYKFSKFDISKLGSGEGEQTYGHGFYFSGERAVAEHYQKALGANSFDVEGKVVRAPMWNELKADPVQYAVKALQSLEKPKEALARVARGEAIPHHPEMNDKAIAKSALELLERNVIKPAQGTLYQVEIPEDEHFLDYDKVLGENPKDVLAKIGKVRDGKLTVELGGKKTTVDIHETTGEQLYTEISQMLGGDKAASAALEAKGVPGLKYFDQFSREKGYGSSNYVVFDENRVKITNVFAEVRDGDGFKVIQKPEFSKPGKSEFDLAPSKTPPADIHVFDASLKSVLYTKPPAFEVKYREDGFLFVPNRKVRSAADLAYAFRQLKNEQQENFFMGAMKNGRIIAIEHIAFGTISEVSVHPFETINLLDAKEADGYFLVHNHPSGEVGPSHEDLRLTGAIRDVLRRNNQKFYGHVIIDDETFGFIDDNGLTSEMKHEEYAKVKKLPVLRKYTEWLSDKNAVKNGLLLNHPGAIYEITKGVHLGKNEVMVVLMNVGSKMLNSAIIPRSALSAGNLQILASRFRAPMMALVQARLEKPQIQELKHALREAEVTLLDSIDVNPAGGYRSASEYGDLFGEKRATYGFDAHEDTGDYDGGSTDFDIDELEHRAPMSSGMEGLSVEETAFRRVVEEARAMRDAEVQSMDPLVEFVRDNGKLRPFEPTSTGERPEMEEFRQAVPLYLRAFKKGTGRPADEMAQAAYDAGLLEEATTNALFTRLGALPGKLPRVADYYQRSLERVTDELKDVIRVQPGIKKSIEQRLVPSREQLPKMYTERAALRRGLQLQSLAAANARRTTILDLTKIKLETAQALDRILPAETAKPFLAKIATLQTPEAALALVRHAEQVADDFLKKTEIESRLEDQKAIREERINLHRLFQRQAASARLAARAESARIREVQTLIVDMIQETLPVEVRGKFVKVIQNARNAKHVLTATARIDEALKDWQKKNLIHSIKRILQKIQVSKSIAIDYRDKINQLVSTIVAQKPSATARGQFNDLRRYVAAQMAQGKDVTVPSYLLERLKVLTSGPLGELELADLENLHSEMVTLAELGKLQFRQKLELEQRLVDQTLDEITAVAKPLRKIELERRPIGGSLTALQAVGNAVKSGLNRFALMRYALTPMDVLFDLMDNVQNFTGPVYRTFKARVDRAYGDYLNLKRRLHDELAEKAKGLSSASFERIGVFAMAQQESGLQKLGNLGVTPEEVFGIKLNEREMAFYRFMRDRLDGMRPRIADVMKELYNRDLGWVRNYFPFITDWTQNDLRDVHERMIIDMPGKSTNVRAGYTKERTGAGRQKILVNAFEIYARHMDDVAYLLKMGETVRHLGRVANSPRFEAAVGDVGQYLVKEWIDTLAKKGGSVGSMQIKGIDILRTNVSAATLALKFSTIMMQPLAVNQGGSVIGLWAYKGVANLADPEWRKFLKDNFPEVRDRAGDDPEFAEFTSNTFISKLKAKAFWPIQKGDLFAASAIASGAYEKFMSDHNLELDFSNPNKDAIAEAERVVRRTQSSASFKDVPQSISRGAFTGNRSLDRLLFQFQNFSLNEWSLIRHEGIRNLAKGRVGSSGLTFFFVILAAVAESGMRGGLDDVLNLIFGYDEDDSPRRTPLSGLPGAKHWEGIANQLLQKIPLVGQAMSYWTYGSLPAPVLETIASTMKGLKGAVTSQDPMAKRRNTIRAIGGAARVLGVPMTAQAEQLARKAFTEPFRKKVSDTEQKIRDAKRDMNRIRLKQRIDNQRQLRDAQKKSKAQEIFQDGKRYVFVPGENGSLTADPKPKTEETFIHTPTRRAKTISIAGIKG